MILKGRFIHTLSALLLAAALMTLLAACGSADKVVIATDGDYHPFNFINDAGEVDGLERELGDELCGRAGLECEWVQNDWEEMIPDLVAEEFDAIFAGMSITAEREETMTSRRPTTRLRLPSIWQGPERATQPFKARLALRQTPFIPTTSPSRAGTSYRSKVQ